MRVLPVRFLPEVEADFQSIADLLKRNGASHATVTAYFDRIIARANSIGNAPEGYPPKATLGDGIRIVQFESSARIAYRVVGDAVEAVRVFYGGQDI